MDTISNKPPIPPQAKLAEAVDHLRKAAGMVSGLFSQLGGSVPTSTGAEVARSYGDGLLSDIERQADQINELAAGIISEASRVSQRL